LSDEEFLSQLPQNAIGFQVPTGYRLLALSIASAMRPFLIHNSATVLDLIAILQSKEFLQTNTGHLWSVIDNNHIQGDTVLLSNISQSLTVSQGAVWDQCKTDIAYSIDQSPLYFKRLPSCASLAFVRALIAKQRGVPLDYVTLFDGKSPITGNLLGKSLGYSPIQMTASTKEIQVICCSYQQKGQKTSHTMKARQGHRIYDLKRIMVQVWKKVHPEDFLLSVRGKWLKDEESLAVVGVLDKTTIDVIFPQKTLTKLYIIDLDEKDHYFQIWNSKMTFGDLAQNFSTDPFKITFFYRGNQLSVTAALDSDFWDPDSPIRIFPRTLEMIIAMNQNDNLEFRIESNWTVGHAIKEVSRRRTLIRTLNLSFQSSQLNENECLLSINPDLVDPFIAFNVQYWPIVSFSEKLNGSNFNFPIHECSTGKLARQKLADELRNVSADQIIIFHQAKELADTDSLNQNTGYVFEVIRFLNLTLQLVPKQSKKCTGELRQQIKVNPDKLLTIAHLIQEFFLPPLTIQNVVVFCNNKSLSLKTPLSSIHDGSTLHFEHNLPIIGTFRFIIRGKEIWREINQQMDFIGSHLYTLVRNEVQLALFGVVSLHYFECKLDDSKHFVEYGIPAHSQINVEIQDAEEITVNREGTLINFAYLPRIHRISDLQEYFSRVLPFASFNLTLNDTVLGSDELLSNFHGSILQTSLELVVYPNLDSIVLPD
jgi:hypothetical protein